LPNGQVVTHESVTTYSREELLRDWEFFVRPRPARDGNDNNDDALPAARMADGDGRVTELEDEVVRLKTQLARAKGINDVMWETLMQNMSAKGKELAASGPVPDSDSREEEAAGADGRARKRGKKTKAGE
jgi:pre-rRNA-processing protein IPI3